MTLMNEMVGETKSVDDNGDVGKLMTNPMGLEIDVVIEEQETSMHTSFPREEESILHEEVRRLLCSARPVAFQTSVNPTASDQDLQQAQLWQLAQRTTTLPLGHGAFTIATTSTWGIEACVSRSFTCPTKCNRLRFAGTKNGDAQELLYEYAIYFLNEVQPPQFAAEVLKIVRVCGPQYWPQVIELVLEDKPWWSTRDKIDPFNSGVLYIKWKVGSCSYVDDPVGCQSLLSQAMHKVLFYLCDHQLNISEAFVDQVVELRVLSSGFWFDKSESLSDGDFQEFYLQVLFECVSKDRPALLQNEMDQIPTVKIVEHIAFVSSVWEAALQAEKDEEAIKPRQCEDLNYLVQESSNTEFARLEELKRQVENFNSSRSSNSVPYPLSTVVDHGRMQLWVLQEHYLPPEKLERLFAVSIKLLTENANLIKVI
ncbi:hypothetical protein RHMOL_Rhmol10G0121700 [Rhododendron molle]|uniref:Uncharacterized protein n=1 Tax=Rhododendron molle TaxID=49168 RepID=A0ACC0M2F5_RHOML|nr:hypothetical protein RHMOL_Rhmol10G0121700 [Rhododendron molle]